MPENNKNLKLEAALNYADLGWQIFPCHNVEDERCSCGDSACESQGKHPRTLSGFKDATTDKVIITNWWTKWPNANVAVVTGKISGISVVDVDCKKDKVTGELIKTGSNEGLPPTLMARSGGKGWHYIYKYVEGLNSKIGFRELVDLKSDGGYIILPPSDHKSGNKYEWHSKLSLDEITPFPAEILEEISKLKSKQNENPPAVASDFNLSDHFEIPVGTRNDALTALTGKLVGLVNPSDWDRVAKPVIAFVNQINKDPLPNEEVASTYKSISGKELAKRGQTPKEKIEIISTKELEESIFPEEDWAVFGMFETGTMNMISADPNDHKSWFMYHTAICLASGKPLLGHFPVKQQKVLVVDEEDFKRQIKKRMVMLDKNWGNLPIYFAVQNGIKLVANRLATEFADDIIALAKEREVGFIIFDSFRCIHDAEENSSTDMQPVLEQIKKINNAGFTVLFSHHNKKKANKAEDSESRGSTGVNAAIHGHLAIKSFKDKDSGQYFLVITQPKLKSAAKMEPFRVLVDISNGDHALFSYDGPHDGKQLKDQLLKKEITGLLEFHNNKGLKVEDFMVGRDKGERKMRETLRVMVEQKEITAMTWGEIQISGAETLSLGNKHNENFYFLPNKEEEAPTDIPP